MPSQYRCVFHCHRANWEVVPEIGTGDVPAIAFPQGCPAHLRAAVCPTSPPISVNGYLAVLARLSSAILFILLAGPLAALAVVDVEVVGAERDVGERARHREPRFAPCGQDSWQQFWLTTSLLKSAPSV